MSIAHLCIGFHLEGEQGGLCKLQGETKVELGTGSENLSSKLESSCLTFKFEFFVNNSCEEADEHLELGVIDLVNKVKGFKASVIARITAHTGVQLLILEAKDG